MKQIISIILILATLVTATMTNFVLVTDGEVFAIEGIYTLIDIDGEVFVLADRPDLNIGDDLRIVFYTPTTNFDDWQIIYAEEH